jgi:transposase
LSDEEWGVISSFLPPKPKMGRRALSDDRSLINGILYVVTTGCRCVKCLESMDHSNCWRLLRRLQEARGMG